MNILFLRNTEEILQEYLREKLKAEAINLIFPTVEESKTKTHPLLHKADVLVGWMVNEAMLEEAKNLKLILNPGVGVEQYAPIRDLLLARNILLANSHGNAYFTAQHTVALLLSACNLVVRHHRFMEAGNWRTGDKEGKSLPLRYRKVGLLGYGAVNKMVHKMLLGFEPEISILKRNWTKKEKENLIDTDCYNSAQLSDFLKQIDTLIIAIPGTPQTENLITEKELTLLGKEGILVNVGRGKIVNEEDLFNALKTKTIKRAAIDVWYEYKPTEDETGKKHPYHSPFHELDNTVLSPHRAASPFNDLARWQPTIENLKRFIRGKKLKDVVDLEEGY